MIKNILAGFGRTFGRFLFYLLLALISYFVINKINVSAAVYSHSLGWGTTYIGSSTSSGQWGSYTIPNGPIWEGFGSGRNGTAIFSFEVRLDKTFNQSNSMVSVSQVYLSGSNGNSLCDIGNQMYYLDSGIESLIYTAKCSVNSNQGSYNSIQFFAKSNGSVQWRIEIQMGGLITGIWDEQQIDGTSQITTTIQQSQQATINAIDRQTGILTNMETGVVNIGTSLTDTSTLQSSDLSDITDNGLGDDVINDTRFSDLILLAPQLLESLVINENVCTNYSFGILLGSELRMPCIEPQLYLGNALWTIIDILFCIALLFPFSRWLAQTLHDIMGLESLSPNDYFGFSDSISRSH